MALAIKSANDPFGGGFAGAAGGVDFFATAGRAGNGALGRAFTSLPFVVDDGFSGRRSGSSAFRLIPADVLLVVGRLDVGAEGVSFLGSDLVVVAETTEVLGRGVVFGSEVGVPVSIDERTELRNYRLSDVIDKLDERIRHTLMMIAVAVDISTKLKGLELCQGDISSRLLSLFSATRYQERTS